MYHDIPPWCSNFKGWYPHGTEHPHGTHDIPHGTEHPHGTQDSPHIYHDIPHGTEPPMVLMISPTVLSTPTVLHTHIQGDTALEDSCNV